MFRTPLTIPESNKKISHQTPIFTIGSCFSDCMGERFKQNKFNILVNPFGTVYNPVSIARLLDYALHKQYPQANTYTSTQGLHANFDFHSSFSDVELPNTKEKIKQAIDEAHQYLTKTEWLIITLGTAFVYDRIDNQTTVANCHKLPSKKFTKRLLSQKQILTDLEPTLNQLQSAYPDLKVIFTVSPVRHIKDTLQQNMVSKATLRIVCETLSQNYKHIHYFPSYEIMMDDLRDYRFYKSDMIHPNDDAEQYIWQQFSQTYFDKNTQVLIEKWSKIKAAINHRPFNPTSDQHQSFIKQTIQRIEELDNQLDVRKEVDQLKEQLK